MIDETGNPKNGRHTPAVQRQYCGNTGKIDNAWWGVHWAYVAGDFQCLMDSDLSLPEAWANDWDRRREAGITSIATERPARLTAGTPCGGCTSWVSHSVV